MKTDCRTNRSGFHTPQQSGKPRPFSLTFIFYHTPILMSILYSQICVLSLTYLFKKFCLFQPTLGVKTCRNAKSQLRNHRRTVSRRYGLYTFTSYYEIICRCRHEIRLPTFSFRFSTIAILTAGALYGSSPPEPSRPKCRFCRFSSCPA